MPLHRRHCANAADHVCQQNHTCLPPAAWVAGWTDAYAATGSGSDYDWQAPGGGDPWFLSDYDAGLGNGGQRGAGGAADVVTGQMGAAVGDPNFGFDQLKSEDWSDQLVNEVGCPLACLPARHTMQLALHQLCVACGRNPRGALSGALLKRGARRDALPRGVFSTLSRYSSIRAYVGQQH